jgi:hypothetical protein
MPTELQARLSIVHFNLSFNGWGDGHGYPGKCPNPADTYLGRPCEYSCADGVSFACKHQGYALPVMQQGLSNGFAYCPAGLASARQHNALIPSWTAQPADFVFVNTGSGAQPGHVEMVIDREGDTLYTFGWDSGPSNVDHFRGQGGCHKHAWYDPHGVGNNAIMATVDLSKLVRLGSEPVHHNPAPPSTHPHPLLMLKSPLMGSPKGWDIIREVQREVNKSGIHPVLVTDGVYGEKTFAGVEAFQVRHGLHKDGIVGPATYHALGIH